MASSTAIDQRIEIGLNILLAEIDDLPNVLADWDAMSGGERASVGIDWDDLLGGWLTSLHQYWQDGEMTDSQSVRFRLVLVKVQQAMPIIERLNFYRPTIPLDMETVA